MHYTLSIEVAIFFFSSFFIFFLCSNLLETSSYLVSNWIGSSWLCRIWRLLYLHLEIAHKHKQLLPFIEQLTTVHFKMIVNCSWTLFKICNLSEMFHNQKWTDVGCILGHWRYIWANNRCLKNNFWRIFWNSALYPNGFAHS